MKTLTFGQALAGFILPLIAVISLVLTGNNIVIALFAAVLVESFYCLFRGFYIVSVIDNLPQIIIVVIVVYTVFIKFR